MGVDTRLALLVAVGVAGAHVYQEPVRWRRRHDAPRGVPPHEPRRCPAS